MIFAGLSEFNKFAARFWLAGKIRPLKLLANFETLQIPEIHPVHIARPARVTCEIKPAKLKTFTSLRLNQSVWFRNIYWFEFFLIFWNVRQSD